MGTLSFLPHALKGGPILLLINEAAGTGVALYVVAGWCLSLGAAFDGANSIPVACVLGHNLTPSALHRS